MGVAVEAMQHSDLAFTEPPGLEAFPRESGGPAGSDSWLVNSKTCRKVVSSRLDA